jgi:hypothetical protein
MHSFHFYTGVLDFFARQNRGYNLDLQEWLGKIAKESGSSFLMDHSIAASSSSL